MQKYEILISTVLAMQAWADGLTFSVDGPGVRSPLPLLCKWNGVLRDRLRIGLQHPCQPPLRTYTIHEVPKEGYVELSDQKVGLGPGELKLSRFVNRFPMYSLQPEVL